MDDDLTKEILRNIKIAKENKNEELLVYIKKIHRIYIMLKHLSKMIKMEEDSILHIYFLRIFNITEKVLNDYFKENCEYRQTILNVDNFYDYLNNTYGYCFYGFSIDGNVKSLCIANIHNEDEDLEIPCPFTKDKQWYEDFKKVNCYT